MLRRQRQIRTQIHQILDAALFALALLAAHTLRDSIRIENYVGWIPGFGTVLEKKLSDPILPFQYYIWLYFIVVPFAPLFLGAQDFYKRSFTFSRSQTAWSLFKGCAFMAIAIILVIFMTKSQAVIARSVIIFFGLIAFLFVYAKEEFVSWGYRNNLAQFKIKKRLILVGTKEDTSRLRIELEGNSHGAVEIVKQLDLNETTIEELVEYLHEHSINGVILVAKHTFFGQIEKAIQACELEGVEAWLIADFFKTQISRTSLDDFCGRPMLVFHTAPEASWQGIAKQALDYFGALIFLIVFSWLYLLIAIVIKLSSPGPIFFKQQRSGVNGRPFTMYKFRSMVTNAEQLKQELIALNEMSGPVFKVTNDPRVTPIGKFLRKSSLDELPQMVNVLFGDMSLVGPRPLPVEEVKRFDDFAHRRRLSVKPGLTCLWQIRGRNEVTDFRDWVRLDLEYIDNWSFWLDLKILWLTIPVVLFTKGAK